MTQETEDKLASARSQAMAQYASIVEMVDTLRAADEDDVAYDDARSAIEEDALSVEVRSDWQSVGKPMVAGEFRILLCTGGPAVQIRGELDGSEPSRAWLECQDWYTPWTQVFGVEQEILLMYARCFYFGE